MRRLASVLLALGLLGACTAAGTSTDRPSGGVGEDTARVATSPGGKWRSRSCSLPRRYLELIDRGTFDGRSPEIMVVPAKPNFFGSFAVTSHSGPWPYLQRVPLVLYGPNFIAPQGGVTLEREVTVADLAPTLAELLGVDWPQDRAGEALTSALVAERPEPPRAILVVVWDGGGWNVLNQWPRAWPNLKRMMAGGTSVQRATVGSSPSVTPAIHATVGTGTWPIEHGVVDLQWRNAAGRVRGSYEGERPGLMRIATLADLYDPTTDNSAVVGMLAERNWHMGMIGHGAAHEGGDKDILVLGSGAGEGNYTNRELYTLPDYVKVPGVRKDVRAVDLEDGRLDDTWQGHEILGDPEKWRQTPIQTRYQTRQIKALFRNEGFGQDPVTDLFYVNYKELDLVGHIYNMVNPESRSVLKQTDSELGELMAFMDDFVGEGRWVMALTADHGQGPDPMRFGAWPIDQAEVGRDAARYFGVEVTDLFDKMRITGFWTNPDVLERKGIGLRAISNWLVNYRLKHNVAAGKTVPPAYRDRLNERLFAAAFPTTEMPALLDCAKQS